MKRAAWFLGAILLSAGCGGQKETARQPFCYADDYDPSMDKVSVTVLGTAEPTNEYLYQLVDAIGSIDPAEYEEYLVLCWDETYADVVWAKTGEVVRFQMSGERYTGQCMVVNSIMERNYTEIGAFVSILYPHMAQEDESWKEHLSQALVMSIDRLRREGQLIGITNRQVKEMLHYAATATKSFSETDIRSLKCVPASGRTGGSRGILITIHNDIYENDGIYIVTYFDDGTPRGVIPIVSPRMCPQIPENVEEPEMETRVFELGFSDPFMTPLKPF